MKRQALCSVIVPAYRSEKYIAACIASVQAQTFRDLEIVVVDDASEDYTGQIVQQMAKEDERIRYLRQEANRGVAAARNRGVEEAAGEWIALLDSDDAWLPEKLEKQLVLQQQSGAELIYTGAQCMDCDGRMQERYFRVPKQTDYKALLKGNDIVCSSVLVKKTWLKRYPMEHGEIHEDYLSWLRMLQTGCKAAGTDEALVYYRLTEGSRSRNKWKAAKMTWATYERMQIKGVRRTLCFFAYALHGLRRYYA